MWEVDKVDLSYFCQKNSSVALRISLVCPDCLKGLCLESFVFVTVISFSHWQH